MKIIFISHDASRTGAPMVLLHFLRWLKENTKAEFIILLKRGGELEKEFEQLAPTYIWLNTHKKRKSLLDRIKIKLLKDEAIHKKKVVKQMYNFAPSLLYANSVVSADVAVELKHILHIPVVCHVHELDIAIRRYVGKEQFLKLTNSVDRYVAVSESVKTNLLENYTIPPSKIDKVYEFIPTKIMLPLPDKQTKAELRMQLNIPEDALVIGSAGTTDWRKGPDIFIQLAKYILSKNDGLLPIHFIWTGGNTSKFQSEELEYDLKKMNIAGFVHFVGAQKEPIRYFNLFDVFVLTSREDPYPLVCLEAASIGKPIICFADAGGMAEFVEEDAGFVVPYLDIETMGNRIFSLIEEPNLLQSLGKLASEKVTRLHDVDTASPHLLRVINSLMNPDK